MASQNVDSSIDMQTLKIAYAHCDFLKKRSTLEVNNNSAGHSAEKREDIHRSIAEMHDKAKALAWNRFHSETEIVARVVAQTGEPPESIFHNSDSLSVGDADVDPESPTIPDIAQVFETPEEVQLFLQMIIDAADRGLMSIEQRNGLWRFAMQCVLRRQQKKAEGNASHHVAGRVDESSGMRLVASAG